MIIIVYHDLFVIPENLEKILHTFFQTWRTNNGQIKAKCQPSFNGLLLLLFKQNGAIPIPVTSGWPTDQPKTGYNYSFLQTIKKINDNNNGGKIVTVICLNDIDNLSML